MVHAGIIFVWSMMVLQPSSALAMATAMACIALLASPATAYHAATNAVGAFSRPPSRRRAFVAPASSLDDPRHHPRRTRPSRTRLAGRNKYAKEDEASQEDILLDLERRVNDYEGRISSKIVDPTADGGGTADDDDARPHRCALVTILGRPNAGKSTLLNALLDDDLAVATSRPQTTRHAILGVLTGERTQLCLTDTPGIIRNPAYRLQEGMMDAVDGAVNGADVFLVVADVRGGREWGDDDDDDAAGEDDGAVDGDDGEGEEDDTGIGEETLAKLRNWGKPAIVCVNKCDLVADREDPDRSSAPARAVRAIAKWRRVLPDAVAILPTCAADGPDDPGVVALRSILLANDPGVDVGAAVRGLGRPVPGTFAAAAGGVISDEAARSILPAGPPLYHPEFLTDRTDRFCASELIRGALFESLGKEIPYCCEVRVESFDESERLGEEASGGDDGGRKSLIRIGATIVVERDSQVGIVVGKGGRKVKDVGSAARGRLEELFDTRVHLDLRVKADKNWRSDEDKLKKYGYVS